MDRFHKQMQTRNKGDKMKGFFNGKKKVNLQKAAPRALPDIKKELDQESWALGQLEYQIYVLKQATAMKNKRIEQLNYEGAERQNLDKAAASVAPAAPAESAAGQATNG